MSENSNKILWTAGGMTLPKPVWDCIETLGFRVVIAEEGEDLLETMRRIRPGAWICRVNGDRESSLTLVRTVHEAFPCMPILLSSPNPSIEEATEAIRSGATEYLSEAVGEERLQAVLEGMLVRPGLHVPQQAPTVRPLRNQARTRPIAVHPGMISIVDLAARIAPSRSTVLIQGESGTGKEVIARFIHENSRRGSGPFVAVNCAALPETLLESELFGHEKGAFTGAAGRKKGKFELAHGGTLLLDEISEMAVSIQAKLLRVLQEHEVDRVGGQTPVAVDVRVIATTNRHLEKEVREGTFRQDLFYRLNVVPLHLPPLRERPDDIAPLAACFLQDTASLNHFPVKHLSPAAEEHLRRMSWPGNVRELENLMERATILVDGDRIEPADLDFLGSLGARPENGPRDEGAGPILPLREMEKQTIFRVLDDNQGNRTQASRILGISVRTLRNKLNEYQKEARI